MLSVTPTRLPLVLPGDPDYDAARSAFNLLLDQHPAAIAFPADAEEVIAAVDYARAAGLRIAPQATGHNQGPLGGLDGQLLLNVSRLQEVDIDPGAKRVRVGAGAKWERVIPRLSAYGLAALHGSSPDVGIAGYSLGGGIGWLARKYGLQANAVTAFELVTADGRLIRAAADRHPDLFWALRGGGGNFGVVTAIEFEVFEVDELYAGALFFEFERSREVLHTWNGLLDTFPDELMTWASLMHFPPIPDVPAFARGRSFAVVMGAFLGSEADGRDLLAPLRALGPARDTFAMVPPVALSDLAMDPLDPLPFHLTHQLLDGLSPEAIDELPALAGPASGVTYAPAAAPHGRRAGAPRARRRRARDAPRRDLHDGAGRRRRPAVRRARPARAGRRRRRRAPPPQRPLPELRRGARRCQPLLRADRLGAPAGGQGLLRRRRPVRRQPPHPAEELGDLEHAHGARGQNVDSQVASIAILDLWGSPVGG